ncbi:MAG: TadE/TadG family type IV pilus assembly protein [Caulobacteraceae bacterium]
MIRRRTLAPHWLARFWRDRRGVSAVEFAFIAPVMVLMFFGVAELSSGMMAERRASDVASTIGDLVARCSGVNDADITDIFAAGATIMEPMSASGLKLRLTSIKGDASGNPQVDWSRNQNWSAGSAAGMPAGMITAKDESVIIAESSYIYNATAKYVIKNGITMNEKFYLKPRKSTWVGMTAGGSTPICQD